MKIKFSQIKPWPIYHMNFATQFDLTMSLLRFQEHLESPKFRGRLFTLEEYIEWYVKTFGDFTYYKDWIGFNIPSDTIDKIRWRFHPHSKKEMEVFALLTKKGLTWDKKYCLIGTYGENYKSTLSHEICHGLFDCSEEYRATVKRIVSKYPVIRLRKHLLDAGYNRAVLVNEIQAYALTGYGIPETQEMRDLRVELTSATKEWTKNIEEFQ